jgi:glycosyltransferase involved in cell wall biosynthesis
MKITIVLGAFFPVPPIKGGAVEKIWFALGQEFARRGHEVVAISRAIASLGREEIRDFVKHLRVRGFDTPRSLLWLKVLDLIYSSRVLSILPDADIIVTNTFWLPILLRNARRGEIYVHVARYPKGQMRFYGHAARLQAPSQAVARAIAAEAPDLKDKITAIPYPAPRPVTSQDPPPISKRDKSILFVGRVHPEKAVHLLVEAFTGLQLQLSSQWNLLIVGPTAKELGGGGESYLRKLKELARTATDKIVFRGPVFDPAQLEQIFRGARLFVYPSLAEFGESFGLAPLEAMAHGCAVVVSNLECFADFVDDGRTGFVFDHRSNNPAQALRERLESVIADPALLERGAEAGYRKSAEFSIDRVADQFVHDFSSILSKSHAARTSR